MSPGRDTILAMAVTRLDKNQNLRLASGQPALQFYVPMAFLNWPKVQAGVDYTMKAFYHADACQASDY